MKKNILIISTEIICIIILCIVIHNHNNDHHPNIKVSKCSKAYNCNECVNGLCKCDYSLEDGTIAKETIECRENDE